MKDWTVGDVKVLTFRMRSGRMELIYSIRASGIPVVCFSSKRKWLQVVVPAQADNRKIARLAAYVVKK